MKGLVQQEEEKYKQVGTTSKVFLSWINLSMIQVWKDSITALS